MILTQDITNLQDAKYNFNLVLVISTINHMYTSKMIKTELNSSGFEISTLVVFEATT